MIKKRVSDLCRTAYNRDIVTFTDFLDLNQQNIVASTNMENRGITIRSWGGYDLAERQITAFIPDALSYQWTYPLTCLEISPVDRRFREMPGHRDFLGALLHLGIERSVLGDLIVAEDVAYVYCLERMAAFICDELITVKHSSVQVKDIGDFVAEEALHFKEITGNVSSVRLDSLISVAFASSRSQIKDLIPAGKVFVNGKMVTSNGSTPKEGDIISVRGMGKFIYDGAISKTKKGRLLVKIKRYN